MRVIQSFLCTAISGLFLGACGSSSPGTINGTVGGKSVSVHSAAFANIPAPEIATALGIQTVAAIVLSDSSNACSDIGAGKLAPTKSYLFLGLASATSPTGPIAGTYSVGSSLGLNIALGFLDAGDATCANQLTSTQSTTQSGSVTLNSISSKAGGSAGGNYSLKMGTQADSISGSFDADYCAALSTFASANASLFDITGNPNLPCQ